MWQIRKAVNHHQKNTKLPSFHNYKLLEILICVCYRSHEVIEASSCVDIKAALANK